MDATRFDALTRWLNSGVPRRTFGLFGASALGGIFTLGDLRDAEGKKRKRKKKKCGPCRTKKKGKCKKHKPNGTPCGDGGTCQGGTCVVPACIPPCVAPATCVDGTCVFPECEPACVLPQTCVDGECVCPASHTCDALCCDTETQCFEDPDICLCGDLLCSCPGDEPACLGGELGGCCLEADSCDLEVGCVTATCSAQNDFNTLAWASCNDNANCWCFSPIGGGTPVCVDTGNTFAFCESDPGCESKDDCEGDDVCVNRSSCGGIPQTGACLTPCATP